MDWETFEQNVAKFRHVRGADAVLPGAFESLVRSGPTGAHSITKDTHAALLEPEVASAAPATRRKAFWTELSSALIELAGEAAEPALFESFADAYATLLRSLSVEDVEDIAQFLVPTLEREARSGAGAAAPVRGDDTDLD